MIFALLSLGASFRFFGSSRTCKKCKEGVYKYIEYAKNVENQEKFIEATKKLCAQLGKKAACEKLVEEKAEKLLELVKKASPGKVCKMFGICKRIKVHTPVKMEANIANGRPSFTTETQPKWSMTW